MAKPADHRPKAGWIDVTGFTPVTAQPIGVPAKYHFERNP